MRLIDAEVFKKLVESWLEIYKTSIDYQAGVQKSLHMIDVMPTVDAEPYDRATGKKAKKRCPKCGAKMDGGGRE